MALFSNSFDGGTDDTNITVAGSGGASGDAFSYLIINNASVPGGGAAIKYKAAAAKAGALGCRITPEGAASTYIRKDVTGGSRMVIGEWVRIPSIPTGTDSSTRILHLRGSSVMAAAVITSGGEIRAQTSAATTLAASAYAVTSGAWYFVQLAATYGTTTSNGRIELRIWDSTGTLVKDYDSGATVNAGTSAGQQLRWGEVSVASGLSYLDIDEVRGDPDKATGWLDVPPSVTDKTSDDSGSVTEQTVVNAYLSSSDSGELSESEKSLEVDLDGSEGILSDSAVQMSADLISSDNLTFNEMLAAVSSVLISSDLGSLLDDPLSLLIVHDGSDSGSLIEDASVVVILNSSDNTIMQEIEDIDISLHDSDSGVLSEIDPVVDVVGDEIQDHDHGDITETESTIVMESSNDTGQLLESQTVVVFLSSSDLGNLGELESTGQSHGLSSGDQGTLLMETIDAVVSTSSSDSFYLGEIAEVDVQILCTDIALLLYDTEDVHVVDLSLVTPKVRTHSTPRKVRVIYHPRRQDGRNSIQAIAVREA